jgi:uncharacterized protein YecT (DUF1311 family)
MEIDMAGPQTTPETDYVRTVNAQIEAGLTACLHSAASQACYQSAYDQSDRLLNTEWKKLPADARSAMLPEQRQWLQTRNSKFGSPDEALKPGAMPATGTEGALASLPSVLFVQQRAATIANRIDR